MASRDENIRFRIEAISDLPDVEKQLLAINDALRAQATLMSQLASNSSSQSSSQVASITAVTTALNAQRTAATAAGAAATSAGTASTTASTAATTAATAHTAATTAATSGYASMGSAVRDFTGLIAGAFAINEIKNFGSDIIDAKTKIDSLKISLDVMLGSKKESAQLFTEMVALAKQTPFSLEEVAENVVKLKAYNIATAELIPTITSLGNIAAAVGKEKLPQLTLAYGQVQNFGRLMGTELRQFTEAGVPLFDLLATSMGKTRDEVIKLTEDHRIMATDVKKAIMDASEAGGKYYNLMALQAKTLGGEVSNLGDTFFVAKARVGDYFEGAIKNGIRTLADLLTATVGSNSAIERTGDIVKSAAAFMATLTIATKAQAVADTIQLAYQTTKNVLYGEYLLLQRANTTALVVYTATQTEAMVAAQGFNAALAANPIGLVVAAVGALVTAYYAYQAINDEVTTQLGEQEIALRTEQSELNALTKAAMNAAEGTQARKNAIDLLIQKYPDYFKGINSETASNGDLKSILDKVNASYMTRISLARQAYALEGVSGEQKQLLQTEAEFFKSLGNEQIKIQFGGDIQKFVETLNSGSAAAVRLKAQLNDTASGGAEFFGAAANSIAGNFKKVEGDYATINTNMQLSDAARVQTAVAAENERWKKQSAELKKGTDAYEAAEKNHLDAVAKINGTFHEAVVKNAVDTAEKTKQVTLLSASEIAVITKGANADTLAEKLKLLDAQEKAEIETVNKRTVNRKISDSALEEMERQAAARILAIHEEYETKRAALQLKADTEARDNRSRSLEVDIAAMQARIEKQREADGFDLITSFNRAEGYKKVAKSAKESEKEIQDARTETTRINKETSEIEAETQRKTIDGLAQMAIQVGGLGGQLASFSLKAFADINLLSGKANQAAADNLAQAQSSLSTMREMYGENDVRVAKQTQAVADANKVVAETSSLTAGAIFQVIQLGQQVLQAFVDTINAATDKRNQAIADGLRETSASLSKLNTLVREANKDILDSILSDTTASLEQRQAAITKYYTEEREMAANQQRLQIEVDFLAAVYQAKVDAGGDTKKFLDAVRAADEARTESQKQFQIEQIILQRDETIQIATEIKDEKIRLLKEELDAFKTAKQAETDALNEELARRKALEAQNSSDDQLRLQADAVFREQLLAQGEAREVAALEAAKQRELVRAQESGASAEEVARIITAFDQLISEKHAEYQQAQGDKTKAISLANQETKAQETDKVKALEAETTAQINTLKDQVAAKDAQVNSQLTTANAIYNEAKRRANYDSFSAQQSLLISELEAEIAVLKARRAPAAIVNDLIGVLNQISGRQNPFTIDVPTLPSFMNLGGALEVKVRAGKAFRAEDGREVTNGETQDGKRVEVTFNPSGKRITLYEVNSDGFRFPYEVLFADGFVPETGQRFFKGSDYLQLGQNRAGRDTIPIWANEGERILPTAKNLEIGGANLTNEQLVGKVKMYDRLMDQFPQAFNMQIPGYSMAQLRLPDRLMNGQLGGQPVDFGELISAFNSMEQTFKKKELLSIQIDKSGFSTALITQQSKITYYNNLFQR